MLCVFVEIIPGVSMASAKSLPISSMGCPPESDLRPLHIFRWSDSNIAQRRSIHDSHVVSNFKSCIVELVRPDIPGSHAAAKLSSRGVIYMRREGKRTTTVLQKKSLALQSLKNWHSQDPLWHQTPEIGIEGLIGTIQSKKELRRAIKEEIKKRLKLNKRRWRQKDSESRCQNSWSAPKVPLSTLLTEGVCWINATAATAATLQCIQQGGRSASWDARVALRNDALTSDSQLRFFLPESTFPVSWMMAL